MSEIAAYYFGCWQTSGHYLYHEDLRRIGYTGERSLPFSMRILDAGLLPEGAGSQVEGQANYALISTQSETWSIVSFWDRSGDKRLSSNSAFIVKGHFNFSEVIEIAKQRFPRIWERFPFEVKLRVS